MQQEIQNSSDESLIADQEKDVKQDGDIPHITTY